MCILLRCCLSHTSADRLSNPIWRKHRLGSKHHLGEIPRGQTLRMFLGAFTVNATKLKTALWRYHLSPELPLLAESCRSIGAHSYLVCRINPPRFPMTDESCPTGTSAHYLRFLHSHGGMGLGSVHSPLLSNCASHSKPARMTSSEYFRYHHPSPAFTSS